MSIMVVVLTVAVMVLQCLPLKLPFAASGSFSLALLLLPPKPQQIELVTVRPSRVKHLPSRTPKSAPSVRPAKENLPTRTIFRKPISQRLEKVSLQHPHSRRKPISRNVSNSKFSSVSDISRRLENQLKSGPGELKEVVVDRVSYYNGANSTPLSKVAIGSSGLNLAVDSNIRNEDGDDEKSNTKYNSNTKTPPVQVSVSPEIQCGSSVMSATATTVTPACYGGGHVLTGVIDKRKCKPRGILTVREAKALDCFECDDESEQENAPGLVNNWLPLPSMASMHWLLHLPSMFLSMLVRQT